MRWSFTANLFITWALPTFSSPSGPIIYGFGSEVAVPRVHGPGIEVLRPLEERQLPTLHLGTIPLAVSLPANDVLFQIGTSVKATPGVGPDGGSSKFGETLKAICVKCFTTGSAVITTTGVKTDDSALEDVLNFLKDPTEVIINALDLNLEVTFEDVSGHFEIGFQFAAAGSYTFPLFQPSTPVGGQIGDTAEAGLLFEIEMIFTVSGQVDVISGFEVEFPSGSSIVLNPISGQLVEQNLKGIKVKAIPAEFKSGAACVTVALRYKLKAGISVEVAGFGFKFEAGAYIDAPQYKACITYQPTLPCELEFTENFFVAAAVYAEAVKEINYASWAVGPTAAATLYKQPLPSKCFSSSTSSKVRSISSTTHKVTPTPPVSKTSSKKSSSTRLPTSNQKLPTTTVSTIKSSSKSSTIKSSISTKETTSYPYGSGTRSTKSSSITPSSTSRPTGTGSLTRSSNSTSSGRTLPNTKRTISPSTSISTRIPGGSSSIGSVSGIIKLPSPSVFYPHPNSTTVVPSGTAPSSSISTGIGGTKTTRISSSSSKSTSKPSIPTYGSGSSSGIIKIPSSSTTKSLSTAKSSNTRPHSYPSRISTRTGPIVVGSASGTISLPPSSILFPNSTSTTLISPPFPTTTGSGSPDYPAYLRIPSTDSTSSTSMISSSNTVTVNSTSTYTVYGCAAEAIWCPNGQISTMILTKTISQYVTVFPAGQTTIPYIQPVAYKSTSVPMTANPSFTLQTIDPSSLSSATADIPNASILITISDAASFDALPTPFTELIGNITATSILGINAIAAYSPTAPQVRSGSTWYVPGQTITVAPGPITSKVVSTAALSGKEAVFTPTPGGNGGYYPVGNETGTGLPTSGRSSGTAVGTVSRGPSSIKSSASASPSHPRLGGYGTEVDTGNVVKRSSASSVRVSARLFVVGLLGILIIL